VEITEVIQTADGSTDHITAHGDSYDIANAGLRIGTKLIAIRTNS
jgi:hypothetical protein